MSSPLCTHCASDFTKLQHIENGGFRRENLLLDPDPCHFCARLWKSFIRFLENRRLISLDYEFTISSPTTGNLDVVMKTAGGLEILADFYIIPLAGTSTPLYASNKI